MVYEVMNQKIVKKAPLIEASLHQRWLVLVILLITRAMFHSAYIFFWLLCKQYDCIPSCTASSRS
jgi:hypothetical protein